MGSPRLFSLHRSLILIVGILGGTVGVGFGQPAALKKALAEYTSAKTGIDKQYYLRKITALSVRRQIATHKATGAIPAGSPAVGGLDRMVDDAIEGLIKMSLAKDAEKMVVDNAGGEALVACLARYANTDSAADRFAIAKQIRAHRCSAKIALRMALDRMGKDTPGAKALYAMTADALRGDIDFEDVETAIELRRQHGVEYDKRLATYTAATTTSGKHAALRQIIADKHRLRIDSMIARGQIKKSAPSIEALRRLVAEAATEKISFDLVADAIDLVHSGARQEATAKALARYVKDRKSGAIELNKVCVLRRLDRARDWFPDKEHAARLEQSFIRKATTRAHLDAVDLLIRYATSMPKELVTTILASKTAAEFCLRVARAEIAVLRNHAVTRKRLSNQQIERLTAIASEGAPLAKCHAVAQAVSDFLCGKLSAPELDRIIAS